MVGGPMSNQPGRGWRLNLTGRATCVWLRSFGTRIEFDRSNGGSYSGDESEKTIRLKKGKMLCH